MTKLNTILSMMTMAAMMAACSVQQREVVNEPPKFDQLIAKDTQKPGEQAEGTYGPLVPASPISVDSAAKIFYWPQGLDELQAQTLVRTVNTLAVEVDDLVLQLAELKKRKVVLENEFEVDKCIVTWAELGPEDDPDLMDWVDKWKAAPSANDPDFQNKSAAREKCIKNQDQRASMPKDLDQLNGRLVEKGQAVGKLIDPGAPVVVENSKSINAKDSSIIIKVSGEPNVEVKLVDFMRPGNTQSTLSDGPGKIFDAHYFSDTRLLTFKVPELDAQGAPTGSVIVFAMERGPDFMELARFNGKIRLVSSTGQILRYGRAKFEGCMTEKCKKTYGLNKKK